MTGSALFNDLFIFSVSHLPQNLMLEHLHFSLTAESLHHDE